jgi:hypothetical protein
VRLLDGYILLENLSGDCEGTKSLWRPEIAYVLKIYPYSLSD